MAPDIGQRRSGVRDGTADTRGKSTAGRGMSIRVFRLSDAELVQIRAERRSRQWPHRNVADVPLRDRKCPLDLFDKGEELL